jgi:ABC-type branched-subunit amino acid transport system substrate-binding protein
MKPAYHGRKGLALSALAACFALFSAPVESSAQEKIGVIAGFSGAGAEYGMAYRRGIELAPIPPGFSFVYEDDQFIPAKTISAFNKLIEHDKISKLIVGDTVTAQAVVPIARRRNIPIYLWASEAGEIDSEPLVTRLWDTNERDFGAFIKNLQKRGLKRVALFTSAHTYANDWGAAIKKGLPGSTHVSFSLTPPSYQTEILKARVAKYDAIGLCLNPGDNGVFARQFKQLKTDIPLFACNFVEATVDIDAAAGGLDGVFFSGPKVTSKFITQYKEKFGSTEHLFSAAVFHDAALLLTNTQNPVFALEGLKKISPAGKASFVELSFTSYVFAGRGFKEQGH